MIPQAVATLTSGIFFGAVLYVNLVEQPARLSCGTPVAVTEWRPSYKRGTLMQAPLALVGTVAALIVRWVLFPALFYIFFGTIGYHWERPPLLLDRVAQMVDAALMVIGCLGGGIIAIRRKTGFVRQ